MKNIIMKKSICGSNGRRYGLLKEFKENCIC